MFTGIITHIAIVENLKIDNKKDCLLEISIKSKITRKLAIGCSIACDGICLTLIKQNKNHLFFQASKETLAKTTMLKWQKGREINIEFAMRIGDEFGGHFVSGHVDSIAKLVTSKKIKDSIEMTFSIMENAKELNNFIIKKGSVCLNGTSLTINKVTKNDFTVNLISHSLENTNFSKLKVGDFVNLEIDLIARYSLTKKLIITKDVKKI